ncbi:EAL domain-containing protein [Hydrogenothermus marinus]|uniref:Diguanylate cyclase (GGDEF)-like protein n=1 Tax=Hydrogenothermus marinus TaxID=133270 RepID=A0A3M0BL89_9AQUI|nr:EAL domain-containing protein [Hydrogenothermus marinus]RMA97927.1 diguanylate cyclase (GGDEF)-like protein [Hydrogenothermus marinus]
MKRINIEILLVIIFALIGLGLILYKEYFYNLHIQKNNTLYFSFLELNKDLIKLKNEIFKANYYLYIDNDNFVKEIKNIENLIQKLKNDKHFNSKIHKEAYKEFLSFAKSFNIYKENLYRFLTYNATIKNSATYIPTLVLRSFSVFDSKKDINLIIFLNKIETEVFISKNAKDYSFIPDLKKYLRKLKEIEKKRKGKEKELLTTFEKHLEIFINYFPKTVKLVEKLSDNTLENKLKNVILKFQKSTKTELNSIKFYDRLFTLLYIFSILVIIYFLFYTEKKKKELQIALITDTLTKLGNRFKFLQDKNKFKEPVFILINIDRFKDINEFYGNSFGNKVLIKYSQIIRSVASKVLRNNCICYRFDSDNFGILFERKSQDIIYISERILKGTNNIRLSIDGIDIDIFASMGVSSYKEKLLETAEMALKKAKEDKTKRFYIFSPEIDKTKEIEKNIKQLRELKLAIKENRLVAFYQPIFDLKTGEIVKYEALARIIKEDGSIIYPGKFLPIAEAAKLNAEITKIILKQVLEKIKETKNNISINLSYYDVESDICRNAVMEMLMENKELAKYLTFEILETEDISDYELYKNFIDEVKKLGCSVVIDDFGSGYSNFDRILKMNIDTIKIDGSLIKNIDKDRISYLVVSTIVDFAKKANIKTVAEFIHSEEVLKIVKELGIDEGQGFYLGKPKPDIT